MIMVSKTNHHGPSDVMHNPSQLLKLLSKEHLENQENTLPSRHNALLTGFEGCERGASDSPYLLVLIIGTSQSIQHDKSESVSYYLTD
ncbi:hypothetical protein Tco_0040889 [Tanacetum coccineum]